MHLETPPETIALNFRLLSKTLKVAEFLKLEPEARLQTLEEAIALLNNKQTPDTDVRRLANYLRALQDADVGEDAIARIKEGLVGWDFAPF